MQSKKSLNSKSARLTNIFYEIQMNSESHVVLYPVKKPKPMVRPMHIATAAGAKTMSICLQSILWAERLKDKSNSLKA
jgi:hypothetical protein